MGPCSEPLPYIPQQVPDVVLWRIVDLSRISLGEIHRHIDSLHVNYIRVK